MTDRQKTNNQLYTERESIEKQIIDIEDGWHKIGTIEPLSATEYDRLSRRVDELSEEIHRPDRRNGP